MRQPSRRQVLKALGVGVAASALPFSFPAGAFAQAPKPAASGTPAAPLAPSAPRTPDAPAPWSWIAPLAIGNHVAYGWKLSSLSAVEQGRVVIGLHHARAGAAEVHAHLLDGAAARGIAHTRNLDLLLMNGARGATPSDESLGLAILALGRSIARNERSGLVRAEQLAALQRHDRIPVNA